MNPPHRHRPRDRRGLAPMELVLWLPIPLMVMALMVIFANGTVWKLRTAAVARDAVWRSRPPRTAANDPAPSFWPRQRTVMVQERAPRLAQLDDPRIDQPVARGPTLGEIQVNRDLLDFSRGMRQGRAEITHHYPMLGKLGEYEFTVVHPLLDDQFRFWEMNIPGNRYRRIPYIYDLPEPDGSFAQAFFDAVMAILNFGQRDALAVLDRDEELRAYYGSYRDFHPRVRSFCEIDPQVVHDDVVEDVVDRIQGRQRPSIPSVAENVAQAFVNMYQSMINDLQQSGGSEAQIAALQQKMQQYQDFLSTLPPQRGG